MAGRPPLLQVAGWLGISDATKVLEESKDSELENGRRQGLGLGATYMPHHKVRGLAARAGGSAPAPPARAGRGGVAASPSRSAARASGQPRPAASPTLRPQEALLSKAEGALARSLRRANVLKPAPAIAKRGPHALAPQRGAKDAGRQQDGESDADEEEGRGRALGAAPRKAIMTRAELFTSAKAAKRQRQKQRSAS